MSELTQEDLEALERLDKSEDRVQMVAVPDGRHVLNPDKFSTPLGMDDNGNFFPEEAKDRWSEKR